MIFLADDFPEHPKVIAAGGDAGWLHVCAMGWLKRNRSTDGHVPKAIVGRLSDRKQPAKLAARLVEVGLWHDRGETFEVHDYVIFNAKDIARSNRARAAARKRWHGEEGADAEATACAQPGDEVDNGTCETDANASANASLLADATAHSPQPTVATRVVVGEPQPTAIRHVPNEPPPDDRTPVPMGSARSVARDIAEEVFSGDVRPLAKRSAVESLLADALTAGRTPEALRRAVVGCEVTWTPAGLSTALAKAQDRPKASGSSPFTAMAKARRA